MSKHDKNKHNKDKRSKHHNKHGKRDRLNDMHNKRDRRDESADAPTWHGENAITKSNAKPLAKTHRNLSIADLEAALLAEFPRSDAEPWDVMGLIVGEGALKVNKVAVTLDPTVKAIEKAASIGANVLITHHPLFLQAPTSFAPEKSDALSSGAGVWAAIQNRVACMNFHTALDVSDRAQAVLPQIFGLPYDGDVIDPISPAKGYGQMCTIEESLTLGQLAARCTSHFGRAPKVWGDVSRKVKKVACALGSAGDIGKLALEQGADVLVCGEVKYHNALALADAGLSIIELGHDLSEFPLVAVLANAIADAGVPEGSISIIDQTNNWAYPETIRL